MRPKITQISVNLTINRTNNFTVNSVVLSYVQQRASLMDGRSVVRERTVNNAVRQSDYCAGAILDSVTSARIELSKHRVGRQ
jgi:hypothetical protein